MKATMIFFAAWTVITAVSAFFNPSYVWVASVMGCLTFAAWMDFKSEKKGR